jgi:N-acetylglutamate synthase-like GNAT family acetyltransferase
MQIRFANRQDEAPVRAFLEARGAVLDLPGADKDLRNLDLNYFGQDGVFVVAEEEGQIIALAGAKKIPGDNDTLELTRFVTEDGTAGDAIKERFLAIIKNHAYQMDYKTIEVRKGLEAKVKA